VSARCDELGPAGVMLRAAAVIGPELDIELLAALLGRPAGAASFAEAARQELAAATPHPMNAFKVELAQRAIVRALNTLTDGDR